MQRRSLAHALLGLAAATVFPAQAQTAYPDKPIRLVVPYAPGGSTSALGQFLAPLLGKALGQSIIVDHRPGGNTTIGTAAVAKSPADGYTILLTASSHVVVPLMSSVPFDPFKDFAPIATLTKTEFVLVVNPAMAARNLREFIAMAKAQPGMVNYGSAGNGSGVHLVAELFAQSAGIRLQHIPYKGSGPMINDRVGGQLQAAFQTPAVAAPFIATGRLRALAVSGTEPIPSLMNVPTLAEAGVANLDVANWFGILAPAGTPKDVVAKLSTALESVSAQAEFKEKIAALGFQPHFTKADRFEADMRAESARIGKLIQAAKITMD